MSELKEYIDRKLMLAKLDSALLFFSSSLSVAFGVGYAYLGTKWLQYYLPMLFLGWFMPIYIGYVRGSLIKNSIEERVRGWIYFIVGLGYYVASPLLNAFIEKVFGEVILLAIPVVGIVSFFLGWLYRKLQSKLIRDIFKIRGEDLRKEVRQAFRQTRFSALFLAILLVLISTVDWSKLFGYLELIDRIIQVVMIIIIGATFVLILMSEYEARKLLRNARVC